MYDRGTIILNAELERSILCGTRSMDGT